MILKPRNMLIYFVSLVSLSNTWYSYYQVSKVELSYCPKPQLVGSNMPKPEENPRVSIFNFLVIFILINYWQVCAWFVHLGLGIAAYTSVVDWDTCAYLLFCWEEEIFCGYLLQVREQFLSCSLCHCCGEHFAYTRGAYYVVTMHAKYWFFCSVVDLFFSFFLSCVLLFLFKTNLFFSQAVCTILAMIATLPLVQLFFFHILLIKKVS